MIFVHLIEILEVIKVIPHSSLPQAVQALGRGTVGMGYSMINAPFIDRGLRNFTILLIVS